MFIGPYQSINLDKGIQYKVRYSSLLIVTIDFFTVFVGQPLSAWNYALYLFFLSTYQHHPPHPTSSNTVSFVHGRRTVKVIWQINPELYWLIIFTCVPLTKSHTKLEMNTQPDDAEQAGAYMRASRTFHTPFQFPLLGPLLLSVPVWDWDMDKYWFCYGM